MSGIIMISCTVVIILIIFVALWRGKLLEFHSMWKCVSLTILFSCKSNSVTFERFSTETCFDGLDAERHKVAQKKPNGIIS